jgi:integrase
MASIANDPGGKRRILFMLPNGDRKAIRLGKVSRRTAESVKYRVEQLLESLQFGRPMESDLMQWVTNLEPQLAKRLTRVGLIRKTESISPTTLGPFLADYIAKHGPTVKPSTITTWKQCKRLLLEYFTPEIPLSEITEGRAVEWRNYMKTRDHTRIKRARKLEETTIRKRCACARQFFEQAVRLKLVPSNPFKSKRIPTSLPKGKQKAFISAELAHAIMQHLPNAQFRLLFALARWGGVRVPSEPSRLKWSDIDWENTRMTIHSPKTEHHEGHEQRVIPIFPELASALQEAWDSADVNQQLILPFLQGITSAALRKPLLKAITAAGGTPWEKLWTALRATRDTELREIFPVHVVEYWIGHEDRVAKRNYTQVTDDHFRAACNFEAKVAQKAAQQVHAPRTQGVANPSANTPETSVCAAQNDFMRFPALAISGDDRS